MHAAPEEGIRRLLEFCEMPHDDGLVAQIREQTSFERHERRGEDAFRRQGHVGDWRSRLTLLDCIRFERASHGLLAETGYEPGSRWWLRALVPRRLRTRSRGEI
jgi:hypothetical protein